MLEPFEHVVQHCWSVEKCWKRVWCQLIWGTFLQKKMMIPIQSLCNLCCFRLCWLLHAVSQLVSLKAFSALTRLPSKENFHRGLIVRGGPITITNRGWLWTRLSKRSRGKISFNGFFFHVQLLNRVRRQGYAIYTYVLNQKFEGISPKHLLFLSLQSGSNKVLNSYAANMLSLSERSKSTHYCRRCRNHGIKSEIQGHKNQCKFQLCKCFDCKSLQMKSKAKSTISSSRQENGNERSDAESTDEKMAIAWMNGEDIKDVIREG